MSAFIIALVAILLAPLFGIAFVELFKPRKPKNKHEKDDSE